jgi:CRISPR-associated exonuclease Cas4
VRIVRGLALHSFRLGLSGKADIVEFPLNGSASTPVEFKRGRPKVDDWDKIQLCAQALCLEEMCSTRIDAGAIFYWETRRRLEVPLDDCLRVETERLAERMHTLYRARVSPPPVLKAHCHRCSLFEICQPEMLTKRGSARTFLRRALQASIRTDHEDDRGAA